MTMIASRRAGPRLSIRGEVSRSVQCWPACHGEVSGAARLASTTGPVCRMTNCCSGPATWRAANSGPVGVDLGGGYVGFDRGRDLLAAAGSKRLARALLHPTLPIG